MKNILKSYVRNHIGQKSYIYIYIHKRIQAVEFMTMKLYHDMNS